MRTIERDDTVHGEEYVLKSEALAEIAAEVAAERERWSKETALIRERSTPADNARRTLQDAFQKMLEDAITYDKERAKRKAP